VAAKVISNSALEVGSSSKSLRRIVLDLGDVAGGVQGGDVVRVYQATEPQQIGRLCQRLEVQPQMRLTARFLGSFGEVLDTELPFAVPTTVEQLLSHDVDFSLRQPLDDWLQFLWQGIDPGPQKEELEATLRRLRVTSGTARYAEETAQLMASFGNICDLLEHYATARVTLADVLELVRYQGGQRFSVAEHGLSGEGQQVAILVEASADGQATGGCAAYLASREPGEVVHISAPGLGDSTAS
jgi:sulfite reductase alpha subunit-like flavoprotein